MRRSRNGNLIVHVAPGTSWECFLPFDQRALYPLLQWECRSVSADIGSLNLPSNAHKCTLNFNAIRCNTLEPAITDKTPPS